MKITLVISVLVALVCVGCQRSVYESTNTPADKDQPGYTYTPDLNRPVGK